MSRHSVRIPNSPAIWTSLYGNTLKGKRNLKRTDVVGYVCVGQDSDPVAEWCNMLTRPELFLFVATRLCGTRKLTAWDHCGSRLNLVERYSLNFARSKQILSLHCCNILRPDVTICTASLTFHNPTFSPHSVFMCFVWIWEQTAIISLYGIKLSLKCYKVLFWPINTTI